MCSNVLHALAVWALNFVEPSNTPQNRGCNSNHVIGMKLSLHCFIDGSHRFSLRNVCTSTPPPSSQQAHKEREIESWASPHLPSSVSTPHDSSACEFSRCAMTATAKHGSAMLRILAELSASTLPCTTLFCMQEISAKYCRNTSPRSQPTLTSARCSPKTGFR